MGVSLHLIQLALDNNPLEESEDCVCGSGYSHYNGRYARPLVCRGSRCSRMLLVYRLCFTGFGGLCLGWAKVLSLICVDDWRQRRWRIIVWALITILSWLGFGVGCWLFNGY